eukprot:GHUV01031549.1.p1 GENE.GHUV01031549.1~~GHUV01031549.1.p1  ORF type:complete len:126 (+),score=19.22 GHUV01031549.1:1019-1396(+)
MLLLHTAFAHCYLHILLLYQLLFVPGAAVATTNLARRDWEVDAPFVCFLLLCCLYLLLICASTTVKKTKVQLLVSCTARMRTCGGAGQNVVAPAIIALFVVQTAHDVWQALMCPHSHHVHVVQTL